MSTLICTVKGCLEDADYNPIKVPPPTIQFDAVRGKLAGLDNVSLEHIIPEYTPVSSQGRAATCVANAMCDGLEMLLGLEHGADKVVQLSRRHLYWVARVTHRATNVDMGTSLHAAAWQAQEVGVCAEEYFPYSDREEDLVVSPPLETYSMASENRVTAHLRITATGTQGADDIEQSIRSNNPVAFGTAVTNSFQAYRGEGVFGRPTDTIKGRHAMLVVGVRYNNGRREFLWRNSWSAGWGFNGHIWVTEEYMTWTQTKDRWMLTRMQLID
jgi:C1A family cysteine protease